MGAVTVNGACIRGAQLLLKPTGLLLLLFTEIKDLI